MIHKGKQREQRREKEKKEKKTPEVPLIYQQKRNPKLYKEKIQSPIQRRLYTDINRNNREALVHLEHHLAITAWVSKLLSRHIPYTGIPSQRPVHFGTLRRLVSYNQWLREIHRVNGLSQTFFASFADLDLSAPLRLENLRSGNAARRIGVKNRIDDIAAARLIRVS